MEPGRLPNQKHSLVVLLATPACGPTTNLRRRVRYVTFLAFLSGVCCSFLWKDTVIDTFWGGFHWQKSIGHFLLPNKEPQKSQNIEAVSTQPKGHKNPQGKSPSLPNTSSGLVVVGGSLGHIFLVFQRAHLPPCSHLVPLNPTPWFFFVFFSHIPGYYVWFNGLLFHRKIPELQPWKFGRIFRPTSGKRHCFFLVSWAGWLCGPFNQPRAPLIICRVWWNKCGIKPYENPPFFGEADDWVSCLSKVDHILPIQKASPWHQPKQNALFLTVVSSV